MLLPALTFPPIPIFPRQGERGIDFPLSGGP
jgi:hypothetical protein